MSVVERIRNWGESPKVGIVALLCALASTLIWLEVGGANAGKGTVAAGTSTHWATGVQLQATLSQPMIVQGEDGTVYLDLSVTTPASRRDLLAQPSDVVVVLDRSGSMSQGRKWPHAMSAIGSLLDRLGPDDRVALVSFDTAARIDASLQAATDANLERLRAVVRALAPGDSTNLGGGLLAAEGILSEPAAARRRRVLLLSDGMANHGIVDPEALASIARRIADRGSVVSTVGMGLGFNETLMAALADHGMGRFSYLEHLEQLGAILTAELSDSRQVYADGSEIRMVLPPEVELLDAAGYPVTRDGRAVTIRTGQLLSGQQKKFMATLRVASGQPASYPLGEIRLDYRVGERSHHQSIEDGRLQVACVPPELESEAVASVDTDVYREAWIGNNVGRLMKNLAEKVREGNAEEARQLLSTFKDEVSEADALAPGLRAEAEAKLKEAESRMDDAFRGRDQATKQNRAAKAFLGQSQDLQRTSKPKQ